ncbi:Homeotic protein ultrabithorax [Zootermopsis nevadensis]|uniref:Homeotic protein ultrabithorax n=1 Tax=Zootermopsis nevadensis TaxID=136037 RepID=A0A067QYG8_ZOONE|nr:Homeotic protein ultrabithorax [Zootermopsis nevadensis]
MNSYFEQSGFYGSHHHQAASSAAAPGHHHDQTAAAAAAYRFPLGLGMSPYASSQHHHHHSLHQARPPQDSPYDASVAAAACKLYSSAADSVSQQSNAGVANYSTTTKPDCSKTGTTPNEQSHQNGYAAVVAAAAKDVWQSAAGGGGANNAGGNSLVGPVVRPAACTPDTRVGGYGSSVGLVGGDPASSPGAGGGRTSAWSLGSSNACSLNSSAAQPTVATQLHQQPSNHTFYPWMAIAGQSDQPLYVKPRACSTPPALMNERRGVLWKLKVQGY